MSLNSFRLKLKLNSDSDLLLTMAAFLVATFLVFTLKSVEFILTQSIGESFQDFYNLYSNLLSFLVFLTAALIFFGGLMYALVRKQNDSIGRVIAFCFLATVFSLPTAFLTFSHVSWVLGVAATAWLLALAFKALFQVRGWQLTLVVGILDLIFVLAVSVKGHNKTMFYVHRFLRSLNSEVKPIDLTILPKNPSLELILLVEEAVHSESCAMIRHLRSTLPGKANALGHSEYEPWVKEHGGENKLAALITGNVKVNLTEKARFLNYLCLKSIAYSEHPSFSAANDN